MPQIACQTETEAPNSHPDHQSEGKEGAQHPIDAAFCERRARSAVVEHRHVSQSGENLRRSAVVEIFDQRFDVVGQAFDPRVGAMSEEQGEIVGWQPQSFLAGIGLEIAPHGRRETKVGFPVGRVDDYFLAEDMSFDAQGKEFAETLHYHIAVEEHRIAVGHKGEIGAGGCENHARNPHAQHHIDIAVAGHFHAGRVDHIIKDEDQHRNDGGQTQSPLANDGAEGGTDEKEEQTRQRQGDALVPLHFMPA